MAWMRIAIRPLVIVLLLTSVGCHTPWLKWKSKRHEPVSSPVEERAPRVVPGPTRYADQPAQTQPADTAEVAGTTADEEDPQLARLQATLARYQARFPNPDGTLPPEDAAQMQSAGSPPPPSPYVQSSGAPFPVARPEPPRSSATPDVATRPADSIAWPVPSIPQPAPPAPGMIPPAADPAPPIVANTAVSLEAHGRPSHPESDEKAPVSPAPKKLSVELVDVRPADADAPPAAPQANKPTDTSPEPVGLGEWIAQLEQDVAQHPQHVDNQLKLRLLYLATGQDAKAAEPLKNVDPLRGELLAALCQALVATRRAIENPTASTEALEAVNELHRLVREQSPIVIQKLALVTRVNSFGDYEAIDPARFPVGQPIHVFCYTEVANFRSEPVGDGRLHTVLAARMEIFDREGKILWQRSIPNIEDRVFTPRHDFFIPLEIKMDSPLPAGTYVLKVTIEDKLGATTDQQRLRFEVGH